MADTVRVDPELLCRAGGVLAGHGEALLALQAGCQRDLEAAGPGWAGASAGALSELLDRWAADAGRHAGRLAEHAGGLLAGAAAFACVDRFGAEKCCR